MFKVQKPGTQIIDGKDVKSEGTAASSGKTPSFVGKIFGSTYQVKRSNKIKFQRRAIGLDKNSSDIVGELYASKMSAEIMGSDMSAEVTAIYNAETKEFMIGSRYLDNIVGDLDQLAMRKLIAESTDRQDYIDLIKSQANDKDPEKAKISKKQIKEIEDKYLKKVKEKPYSHVSLGIDRGVSIPFDKEFKYMDANGEEKTAKIDKKSMTNAQATRTGMGDNDANPANFMAYYDNGVIKIKAIDYGHAGNDLIKEFGPVHGSAGSKYQYENSVIDAFNRDRVNGSSSKYLRNFGDLTITSEMVESLRETAHKIEEALKKNPSPLDKTLEELSEVYTKAAEVKDIQTQRDIEQSLLTLAKRSGGDYQEPRNASFNAIKDAFKATMESANAKKINDMREAANVIEAQVGIENILLGKEVSEEQKKAIKDLQGKENVDFLRHDRNEKPFSGNMQDYVAHAIKEAGNRGVVLSEELQRKFSTMGIELDEKVVQRARNEAFVDDLANKLSDKNFVNNNLRDGQSNNFDEAKLQEQMKKMFTDHHIKEGPEKDILNDTILPVLKRNSKAIIENANNPTSESKSFFGKIIDRIKETLGFKIDAKALQNKIQKNLQKQTEAKNLVKSKSNGEITKEQATRPRSKSDSAVVGSHRKPDLGDFRKRAHTETGKAGELNYPPTDGNNTSRDNGLSK